MVPPLHPLPYRKVRRALHRLGFREARQVGSHVIFTHEDGRLASVPRHDREELSPGFLRRILAESRIDVDAFVAALR